MVIAGLRPGDLFPIRPRGNLHFLGDGDEYRYRSQRPVRLADGRPPIEIPVSASFTLEKSAGSFHVEYPVHLGRAARNQRITPQIDEFSSRGLQQSRKPP